MEEQAQEDVPAVQHTGGHHPVWEGEVFNARYQALRELGCGAFATVWLCQDMRKKKNVAVKVLKSREGFAEAAQDELSLLRCVWKRLGSHLQICRPYPKGYEPDSVMQEEVKNAEAALHPGRTGSLQLTGDNHSCLSYSDAMKVSSMKKKDRAGENIVCLLDDFRMIGENGFHMCLVFEALGPSLQFLMGNYAAQGLPLPFVKKSLQQVLAGLHFLHGRCRIIHADIKPENVLLCVHDKNLQSFLLDAADCGQRTDLRLKASGGDPGNQLEDSDFMSIEVKIADLGSACWTYKPFSKEIQTQPYRALEVLLGLDYGTPADIWSTGCLAFEMATGECLFNPQPGKYFSRDDDHVARIIELLGRIPPQIAFSWNKSTKFFRRPGALLRISRLIPRSLHTILTDRLKWRKHEVPPFTSFLLSALRYAPEKRATAAQCLQHAWLSAP